MSAQRNSPSTLGLVLGGGGAVGVGWQVGMLTGLRDAGVDLSEAEEVLGTSAGALVGALLASGREITSALNALAALARSIDAHALAAGNDAFLAARRRTSLVGDSRQLVRDLGRVALEANTLAEDAYVQLFSVLENAGWPPGFRCTAIDADSGDLVVWNLESDVPLVHAVASSCALPAVFPPVTLNGRRYMDGGLVNDLNASLASPVDVLVLLSCHPLGPRGVSADDERTTRTTVNAELNQLRETTRLVVIEPDFSGFEVAANLMMDANVAAQAVRIGRRQADREGAAIRAVWQR